MRFWEIYRNASSKSPSYVVRRKVGGKVKATTFKTKALAENFLSDLRQAAKRGEAFDVDTGLPVSMLQAKKATTFYTFALAYVDMKWPHAVAKTRDSMTDALSTVLPAIVDPDVADRPDAIVLRSALRQHALSPATRHLPRPPEIAEALSWLDKHSLPVEELAKPRLVRLGLDALTLRLDGTAAAATTIARKRSVFYNTLQYAVDLESSRPTRSTRSKRGSPRRSVRSSTVESS
ncbi:hypothetical protein [Herbidospora cretacea]|uniref:hypothetical protein n=1 Tax=Herbidospora cretacea TaxID=28444 RepID=UPI002F356C22